MTTDVSIDLETLGLGDEAMILSIGAVKFDRNTGEISEMFHALVEPEKGNGTIDLSTVIWWMNQSEEARAPLFSYDNKGERVPLAHALMEFSEWLGLEEDAEGNPVIAEDLQLWQRGNKDATWLTSAYTGLGLTAPFKYWQWNDQRTLTKLCQGILPQRDGTHHNALADALYQARCLITVFNGMGICKELPWVSRQGS